jgi:acetylornithine deacetylase/succinyl-diaminopimelate desuccinylase-like protein
MGKSILLAFMLKVLVAAGQSGPNSLEKISNGKTRQAIEELREFVALPNDANVKTDIQLNAEWLQKAFLKRRFNTKILPTENTPLVFAEKSNPKANITLLFYMHYDGQAVDPSKWFQENPYKAVMKERNAAGEWSEIPWGSIKDPINPAWRMFGRSTSDDKGPIVMFLAAVDALEENKLVCPFNIKVILDGEEEKSSAQLDKAVDVYKDLLRADHMVINDGPVHLSGKPTLAFGCRGVMTLNVTVYGPKLPLHSGHYGNYAPNPVFRLSKLLAGMKDDDGRVIIPGYYEGIVLDEATKKILAAVPDDVKQIHETIGIAEPERVGANYQESLQYPSLNVRGMLSAYVGNDARTIVPSEATAAIDIRLVPESDPDKLKQLVKRYIESEGYYIIDRAPTDEERLHYPKISKFEAGSEPVLPFRTDLNSSTGQWLDRSLQKAWGVGPVKIRIMGGSVPIALFINKLKVPAVIVPMVNADNNQHSENENLAVANITGGIRTFLAILTEDLKK